MKILKIIEVSASLLIILAGLNSCNNHNNQVKNNEESMHSKHNLLADNFRHKGIAILDEVYHSDSLTKTDMISVVEAYLMFKNSLIEDSEQEANHAIDMMAERVSKIFPEKMDGQGLETWRSHQALYLVKLKEMRHIDGLENKRSYFSHISEIMYCTIKSFGLTADCKELYVDYCPMAFNGKGAYWLSETKRISNPYFGSQMEECGEIREVLIGQSH